MIQVIFFLTSVIFWFEASAEICNAINYDQMKIKLNFRKFISVF
jgi:hypothetical protein